MKYLEIEYKINGLQEGDVKAIEDFLLPFEKEYFDRFKKIFPKFQIPKIQLLISDDIWKDIEEFYSNHGTIYKKIRPKGLDHLIKIASYNEDIKYFWPSQYLGDKAVPLVFQVIIENLIGTHLKVKHNISESIIFDRGIQHLTKTLFNLWLVHKEAKDTASKIVNSTNLEYESMEDLTFAFKKNIKHFHHEYQSFQDHYNFLIYSILEFEIFFKRILSYQTTNNLSGLDEFKIEILSLIKLVENSIGKIGKLNQETLQKAKILIIDILKKCDINLYEDKQAKNVGFKISKGPKKLFPTLIDTHPRIISFIDILGFKALIEEYESENSSLVLKKLKKVFDSAIQAAFKILTTTMDEDIKEEIEYRMFSDCIIISLPYIEFGVDIKQGFFNMALILNILQQTFMRAGFYLRGHVTLGSYYSDENMLFSGGLVEAYMNEKSTFYPIISINNRVISKLLHKTEYDRSLPSFNKLILKHNFAGVQNKIFMNPFYTIEFYNNIDKEINNVFNSGFGIDLSKIGFDLSFKSIINKEFNKQGLPNIDKEFEKDKKEIFNVLIEKYNEQINVYQNLRNDNETRMLASSIIEKYKFLYNLFKWLLDSDENENFEYVELNFND